MSPQKSKAKPNSVNREIYKSSACHPQKLKDIEKNQNKYRGF
jgi:hypothetical protein